MLRHIHGLAYLPWYIIAISCSPANDGSESAKEVIQEKLAKTLPHLTVFDMSPSAMPSLYQIEVEEEGTIFYASVDGKYLIAGDMYFLSPSGLTNLTEPRRNERRRNFIRTLEPESSIVYATRPPKTTVHVFTDVDCAHCQRLHSDMASLNRMGIEVHYLAFPRWGVESPTFRKMRSAWCSTDRKRALTELKLGNAVPDANCQISIQSHLDVGRLMGIDKTPSIVRSDGTLIEGYNGVEDLAKKLGMAELAHDSREVPSSN